MHYRLFNGLMKRGCEAFAGNYRGSAGCLANYVVVITDGKTAIQTAASADVSASMATLSAEIAEDFDALAGAGGAAGLQTMNDVVGWLDIAMERMVSFLGIHPYADGNGHIGRFMMFCYLSAAGIWPNNWPLDDRPPHPYDEAIAAFRNGYVDGLRDVMLQYISWQPTLASPSALAAPAILPALPGPTVDHS
ncbi:Fic family protein [Paraburkholderia graminis]|uniref:Fic family protein n=1 Tax=Paraburkholderia graminis TaxID=60548 RepID=UPI0038B8E34D